MIKIEREWERKAAAEREREKRKIQGETEESEEQGHVKESRENVLTCKFLVRNHFLFEQKFWTDFDIFCCLYSS